MANNLRDIIIFDHIAELFESIWSSICFRCASLFYHWRVRQYGNVYGKMICALEYRKTIFSYWHGIDECSANTKDLDNMLHRNKVKKYFGIVEL